MEASVGPLLRRVQTLFQQRTDAALASLGLGVAGYAALQVLALDGPTHGAALARRCGVTPQALHRVSTLLENRGLIEGEAAPARRRILSITARGLQAHDEAWAQVQRAESELLAALDPSEVDGLVQTLERCLERRRRSEPPPRPE